MIRARSKFALAIATITLAVAAVAAVASTDWLRTLSVHPIVAVALRLPVAQPLPTGPASERVGRAALAPLLLTCAPKGSRGPDHRAHYWIMQTGIRGAIGVSDPVERAAAQMNFAKPWFDLTNCVYSQDGPAWCDPDNRALAIETITTFVRLVNDAAKADAAALERPEPGQYRRREISSNGDAERALKDRVLSTLRTRVQEGRLVARDFDYFLPEEILAVLRRTPTTEDACARS